MACNTRFQGHGGHIMGWPNRKRQPWISQSKLPNKMKDNPTTAFRSRLSPEAADHLRGMNRLGLQSQFINDAIEMKVWHDKHPKGFLLNMIQNNFELCKHLLRQVGRSFSSN